MRNVIQTHIGATSKWHEGLLKKLRIGGLRVYGSVWGVESVP